jgi:hypothetical protein
MLFGREAMGNSISLATAMSMGLCMERGWTWTDLRRESSLYVRGMIAARPLRYSHNFYASAPLHACVPALHCRSKLIVPYLILT